MRKSIPAVALVLAILGPIRLVYAQQSAKVFRIGYLGAGSASVNEARREAFRQGLRDLGYVEGKNVHIEYRWADGKLERIPELAAELVGLNLDVILTYQTPSVLAVKKASAKMPIVFAALSHPVENGIIASFARPGGNITGLTVLSEELNGKRLELLKETVSTIARIGLLSNLDNPTQPLEWRELQPVAQGLGVKLLSVGVRSPADFEGAFQTALKERVQGLMTVPEALLNTHRHLIVEFAVNNKLPAIYSGPEYTQAGGLMSYGPNIPDLFRRAATFIDKILKGARPGELPVERPAKFELFINLQTAKRMGLTIPPGVLAKADKVIK